MTWVQLDDKFPDDPKVIDAIELGGSDAGWLWVCALAHCNKHSTDGAISAAVSRRLHPACKSLDKAVAALVKARLWERTGDGFTVVNFLKWNTSKEQVEERKAAAVARKGKWKSGDGTPKERVPDAERTRSEQQKNAFQTPKERVPLAGGGRSISVASRAHAPGRAPLLSSPVTHTHSEPVGEPCPTSPLAASALDELRALEPLAEIATIEIANAIAGVAGFSGKSEAQVRQALRDAARKAIGASMSREALFATAKSCVQYAHRIEPERTRPTGFSGQAYPGQQSQLGEPTAEELARAFGAGVADA